MDSVKEIAFLLLDTLLQIPDDQWVSKLALGRLGVRTKDLLQLTRLPAEDLEVGLSWLFHNDAIEVIEDPDPSRKITYRWVKNVTTKGKYIHKQLEGERGMTAKPVNPSDPRKVFVVHGRNERARRALFDFLRSLSLDPQEWNQWVHATGEGSPYVGEVLKNGFQAAQAFVVLMTPDDEAQLREPLRVGHEEAHEITLTPQPRPNVIYEAGMAMGIDERRTILVELGRMRPMSDIFGRHVVRINNTPQRRKDLAQRLENAGCPVDMRGDDWLNAGDFDAALEGL